MLFCISNLQGLDNLEGFNLVYLYLQGLKDLSGNLISFLQNKLLHP